MSPMLQNSPSLGCWLTRYGVDRQEGKPMMERYLEERDSRRDIVTLQSRPPVVSPDQATAALEELEKLMAITKPGSPDPSRR